MRKIIKNKYGFIDPSVIMGIVVALILLAVGVFAFFTIAIGIPPPTEEEGYSKTEESLNNISKNGTGMFNIIGIVLIIGAIMAIVGLVYNYVGPMETSTSSSRQRQQQRQQERKTDRQMQKEEEKRQKEERKRLEKLATVERKRKYEERGKYYTNNRSSRTAKAAELIDKIK